MPEGTERRFDRHSRVRDVLALGERGETLLFDHGYEVGQGFVDFLSQHQTLEEAARAGRLRDLPALLAALNHEPQPQDHRQASIV